MREAQGGLDVFGLGTLITAGKQNDQLPPELLEIYPVTGTIIDSKFGNAFANGLNISRVSPPRAVRSLLGRALSPECRAGHRAIEQRTRFYEFESTTHCIHRATTGQL